jgi:hypothetical protein
MVAGQAVDGNEGVMKVLVTAASKHGATAEIAAATTAREHRVFAGKLVRKQLGFGERAIVVALRVPDGDLRNWPEIRSWASEIADSARSGA